MAVIALSSQQVWLRARWVVRRLLEDTLALFPDDAEMAYAIQQGLALDGLHFDLLDESLAKRLVHALLETIERQSTSDGAAPLKWSEGLSDTDCRQYLESLQELKAMLET